MVTRFMNQINGWTKWGSEGLTFTEISVQLGHMKVLHLPWGENC